MTRLILRDWIRAACVIAGQLDRLPHPPPELPLTSWERCRQLERLLAYASERGWRYAERRCRDRLHRATADLGRQLEHTHDDLQRQRADYLPSPRELCDDLRALQQEFASVELNLKEGTLSVVTESVALEGIDLGPFEIQLDWRQLGANSYLVRALRGSGAACDDSVIHPHVRDEELCEGDAHTAIRAALRTGRLLDFFTIVTQTLATYNPQSAFVSLNNWEGTLCRDCGASVPDDEGGSCERCDAPLCGECDYGCTSCGFTSCSDCGASCAACSEYHCADCVAECATCRKTFCKRCLDEEQCLACRGAAAQDLASSAGQTPADSPSSGPPGDPADALRVGQTPLPA